MSQENTQNEGENQNNAESNSDSNTQEISVDNVESLKQQLADKDRKIQEEVNRRLTVEARFANTAKSNPPKPEVSMLDKAKAASTSIYEDPDSVPERLKDLVESAMERGKNEAAAIISVQNEMDSLKKNKSHLKPFMPLIQQKASDLMNAGLSMKDALKAASDEYQKEYEGITGNKALTKADKEENSSMKGNMGNKTPIVIKKKSFSVTDEMKNRNITQRSKFSLSK